jgi:hypothetical protein
MLKVCLPCATPFFASFPFSSRSKNSRDRKRIASSARNTDAAPPSRKSYRRTGEVISGGGERGRGAKWQPKRQPSPSQEAKHHRVWVVSCLTCPVYLLTFLSHRGVRCIGTVVGRPSLSIK